jgi:hypothetical protein
MGEVINFTKRGSALRLVSNFSPALMDDLRTLQSASAQFDQASEALSRRDFDGFDRIMGKRRYAPTNGDAA